VLFNEAFNCQGCTDLEPRDSKYSKEENECNIEETKEESGASLNMINFKVYICTVFFDILIKIELIKVPILFRCWL